MLLSNGSGQQLPSTTFSYNSSQVHNNNSGQYSPLPPSCNVPKNVRYSHDVPLQPSVKLLDHSNHNPLPKGHYCATYSKTAPKNFKFKFYNRSCEKKYVELEQNSITAKLSELKLDTSKNPISKLNEIMLLQKKIVEYHLVSVEGYEHRPVFTFHAKSGEMMAYGRGYSKKCAKNNAAIAFLDQIGCNSGNNDIMPISAPKHPSSMDKDPAVKISDIKTETNPIGIVQEICIARHWQLPDYKCSNFESNKTHNTWFTVKCSLVNFKTKGEGETKQAAKKHAACLMYDKIKDMTQEEIDALGDFGYETPFKVLLRSSKSGVKNTGNEFLKQIEKFCEKLKSSKKPFINNLKKVNLIKELSMSAVEFLDKMGEEEGFTTTFIKISGKSQLRVLVQVTIIPVMLHLGTGATVEQAQEAAASTALLYIKLMIEE